MWFIYLVREGCGFKPKTKRANRLDRLLIVVHGQIMILLLGGFAEEIPTNDPLLKDLRESFQFFHP